MKLRSILLAFTGAVLLASCGEPGAVYQIPAKDMRQKLLGAKPPPILFGSHYTTTRSYKRGDGSVVWAVSENNKPLFRFIGETEAVDENSTKIVLSIAGPTDDENDPVAKRFEEHPQVAKLYLRAMEEAIDSKLTGREFDMSKFQAEMMAAALAEIPNIQNQVKEAAEASQEMDRMMKDAQRSAADAEWERQIESQIVE